MKIQQMYNDLNLKSLFVVTGAHYASSVYYNRETTYILNALHGKREKLECDTHRLDHRQYTATQCKPVHVNVAR